MSLFMSLNRVATIACLCGLAITSGCVRMTADSVATTDPVNQSVHVADVSETSEWTGWRGGLSQGVAAGSALPTSWADDRNIVWRVPLAGEGNSSPVVWENKVFVTAATSRQGSDVVVLYCFDRPSGDILWQTPVDSCNGPTHARNGYASSTPVTDGRFVYLFSGSGCLISVDVSGELQWRTELGRLKHDWGLASSAILFGDLVIQVCDSQLDSYVVALNRFDGRQVWKTERNSNGSWTSPVLCPVKLDDGSERIELIVNGTGHRNGSPGSVIAYSPDDGRVLWTFEGTSDIPCPSAIVGDGIIVSTSGANGPIAAIRPGGEGDISRSHLLWKLPNGGPQVPTGLISRGMLFTVSDNGVLSCRDLATGDEHWRERVTGRFLSSLVASEQSVYAINQSGDIFVFRAAETFELLAINLMNERCAATPAIHGNELFVRTERHLICIGSHDLTEVVDLNRVGSGVEQTSPTVFTSPSVYNRSTIYTSVNPETSDSPIDVDSVKD